MTLPLTIFIVAIAVAAVDAHAQHEGHAMAGETAAALPNPACAPAGRKALAIVETASARLESAPRVATGDMGAAIADLQRAVGAAQAQLFTCRAAVPATSAATAPADAMAGMDHAKMAMGKPAAEAKPSTQSAKPDAMAGMDHSNMAMGTPVPTAKPTRPVAKPDAMAGMDDSRIARGKSMPAAKPAARGAKPVDAMAGMDHPKMAKPGAASKPESTAVVAGGGGKLPVAMAERIADPACPNNVGQATAPKAVYQRKVYYFCSPKDRDEFRKNPAAYLKKRSR